MSSFSFRLPPPYLSSHHPSPFVCLREALLRRFNPPPFPPSLPPFLMRRPPNKHRRCLCCTRAHSDAQTHGNAHIFAHRFTTHTQTHGNTHMVAHRFTRTHTHTNTRYLSRSPPPFRRRRPLVYLPPHSRADGRGDDENDDDEDDDGWSVATMMILLMMPTRVEERA